MTRVLGRSLVAGLAAVLVAATLVAAPARRAGSVARHRRRLPRGELPRREPQPDPLAVPARRRDVHRAGPARRPAIGGARRRRRPDQRAGPRRRDRRLVLEPPPAPGLRLRRLARAAGRDLAGDRPAGLRPEPAAARHLHLSRRGRRDAAPDRPAPALGQLRVRGSRQRHDARRPARGRPRPRPRRVDRAGRGGALPRRRGAGADVVDRHRPLPARRRPGVAPVGHLPAGSGLRAVRAHGRRRSGTACSRPLPAACSERRRGSRTPTPAATCSRWRRTWSPRGSPPRR